MMEKLEAGMADEKSGEVLGEVYVPPSRMVMAGASESRREERWKLVALIERIRKSVGLFALANDAGSRRNH